ncbi:MAG: queuosine precursor transporter [Pseudomonadota bacterium]|nr:queuosine precursor transporter [Pseudomonadota bacterium]
MSLNHRFDLASVSRFGVPVVAMALVVALSNQLVHYPVEAKLGPIDLAHWLTWGAFTYPVAFLVTDLTNRLFGPVSARRVVYVGFALGVLLTFIVAFDLALDAAAASGGPVLEALLQDDVARAALRVTLGSGTAFLTAQLIDVMIFNRLRRLQWWKAPVVSSFGASLIDTVLFFSIAFAMTGQPWVTWAVGDFCTKLIMIAALLYPFKLISTTVGRRLRVSA